MTELLDQLVQAAGGAEVSHSPAQVAARLAVAFVVGWVLGFAYKRTHTGDRFRTSIPHAQMLLAVGGALIWLVVGDNLVRAFGLAGTIGLIRYRTRIRDPKDTTVLLFSMILGMACGLGQYTIALIGLAFVVLTLVWLSFSHRRETARLLAEPSDLTDLLGIQSDPQDKPDPN